MPCIISTPEEWFRSQQRDLYVIEYRAPEREDEDSLAEDDEAQSRFMQAQKELNAWFEERLPLTPLRIIGASEYSGWITGGPGYFTADFDPAGLALFNAEWDENSAWYIETWPISVWQQRIEAAQLLPSPVGALQKMQWWDTPQGILLLSGYPLKEDAYCENGFLSVEDGWWRLQQLVPELSEHQAETFPCGQFWPFRMDDKSHADIFVRFVWNQSWESRAYIADPRNLQRLREAIGIPKGIVTDISLEDI